ncbi:MAG TPA: adenosylmethionine--8-amino-7-oxononanoate transaminase [Polyangia bacterium]|nr:adenosylmethionine--8-amino-7-oxononanoate transaminase [Polyangia bacterium]
MNLSEKDRRYVWHPFTQMRDWTAAEPLIIARAEGNELIDTDGRRYLDGVSSLWVNLHGHHRRELDDAVRAQLDRVAHSTLLGLANVPSIELAERLVKIAPPGLSRVFYSDSGSTAVEVALKIAFQYQKQRGHAEKRKFLALTDAYHGDTVGAVSVGGIDLFHEIFHSLLFHVLRVPPSIDALEQMLAEHGHELAALVVEPLVQGAAGMLMQPPGFLRAARELCSRHEVLLVCDEVATGFGRTGTMFACEQESVSPDLLCLAKGISGGYLPLAATLATEQIYSAFLGQYEQKLTFFHGHTYTGNPLACAAGIASLDLFERDRVLEKLQPKIGRLHARLDEQLRPLKPVVEIRRRGFMVGVELGPYAYEQAIGARVCMDLRARGVILRPLGNVIVMMPPLSITDDEIDRLVDATRAAIAAVCGA